MSDKDTYGRSPVVIVELIQPRCSNRFGTSPCTATGTPKCYNTYWTCLDKANYNTGGEIVWRFTRPGDNVGWLYEQSDGNNIKTNAIPILASASHSSSRINPGAARKGESPIGGRAVATITLYNGVWDDHVGDYYKADRTARDNLAGFWTLFRARNTFTPGAEVVIYEGYEGQALGDMQARRFEVDQIDGPDGSDRYTITARDPLDRIRARNAKYPPTSQIDLREDINGSQTTIPVTCVVAQLSATYGNTTERYAVIGNEIVSYTGWSGTAPDLTLTGVMRGVLGSIPAAHAKFEAVQRGAYHVSQRLYEVARYILKDHTTVPNSYINDTQWNAEGGTYLGTLKCRTFIGEPVPVETLLGELCRDGLFSIYWDDRRQTIPLLAVRPPNETPLVWNDDNNLVELGRKVKLDDRMTRVSVFFQVRDWLASLTEGTNFKSRRIRIDGEVERDDVADGKVVENTIYSRWVQTFSNALLVSASLLLRYRLPPEYLTITLDAKDRDVQIGDVVDLTSRKILDAEGDIATTRWQVIAVSEPKPGSRVQAELQSYVFVGRFAFIMANDAPDFATATAAEKESGCWIAENTGLMPDGTDGYLLQ